MIRLALLSCVFSTGGVLFGFDGLSEPAALIAVALFFLPALTLAAIMLRGAASRRSHHWFSDPG
jgi:uncharacterized membrane protein YtjA (UPF0391 family)